MKTLTDYTKEEIWSGARDVLGAFTLNWKLFLGIHLLVNILSLLVLTPLVTLLIGWLILASGHTALTDEDILYFALSPTGTLIILLAGALYTTVVIFEQAAMITSSQRAASGQTLNLSQLGRYLLLESWSLFRLSLQMIGRSVLLAAPFLAVGVLIHNTFLTEFDINFYLAEKPPVFFWAGALILLCLMAMTWVLLRAFSGWVLALPLLLIDNEYPARALKTSRKASASMRTPITMTLLALFLLNTGLFAFVSMLADFGVDGVVVLSGSSLKVMAYLLGSLLIVWLAANVAVTFLGNSLLSLFILKIYNRLIPNQDEGVLHARLKPARPTRIWHASKVKVVGVILVTGLAAGFSVDMVIERLNLEDHTMIMAHRGASADAPENTLAALELAISEGADWVEIDVQETREGEILVIHDSDLKRVGGSGLKVFESPLAELQKVDIGSWKDPAFSDQRVPTLQQVLALCKNRIKVVIELKYYGREEHLEEGVANLVEAAGMQDQIAVMSLSYPGVLKMKTIRPQWMVGLLSSVAIGDITRLKADFFAVNAKFASRSFIKQVHKRNRKVMVWTVNDPISMSAMMSKGVDGIITDKPGLASMIKKERSELGVHERSLIQLASYIGKQPTRPEQ